VSEEFWSAKRRLEEKSEESLCLKSCDQELHGSRQHEDPNQTQRQKKKEPRGGSTGRLLSTRVEKKGEKEKAF